MSRSVSPDVLALIKELRQRSSPGTRSLRKSMLRERSAQLQVVLQGAVLRQRLLENGRRQTVAIYYSDDVINLTGYLGSPDSSSGHLQAIKGTLVGSVDHSHVADMQNRSPVVAETIAKLVYRELRIAQEHILSLAQRSAVEAMAHFFCETQVRCSSQHDEANPGECPIHITHEFLAGVLGISTVHVSRTLVELRNRGLATIVRNRLRILDFRGLVSLAEFDSGYLGFSE